MLKRSILLETDRKTVEELDKTMVSLSNKLSEIENKIAPDEYQRFQEELNKSLIESESADEEINGVSTGQLITSSPSNQLRLGNHDTAHVPPQGHCTPPHPADPVRPAPAPLPPVDLFQKLANPLEKILSKFPENCTDPERTVAIKNFPVPRTVKQVRQFTGMCGYWRKYIENYADISRPLHALKRKNTKFLWTAECQGAYETLKEKIANPPILTMADFNKPFVVHTDASATGAGAALLQYNESGDLMPIAFYSKSFTENELRYSIYEKEAYTAVLAMEKWNAYLSPQPFTLVTDNQALSYVLNTKNKLGRLSRWVERLLALPFNVVHKPGTENVIADALSRLYELPEETSESNTINVSGNNTVTYGSESAPNPVEQLNMLINELREHPVQHHGGVNFISEIPMAMKDLKYHQRQDKECKRIMKSINDVPRTLVSDNATYFTSQQFKAYLFKNYVTHHLIALYRPSANRVERQLRDLGTLLKCYYANEQSNWDAELQFIQMTLNTAKNSSTGFSPFSLMFFHEPRNALSNIWNLDDLLSESLSRNDKVKNLTQALRNVKSSIARSNKREKYSEKRIRHLFKVEMYSVYTISPICHAGCTCRDSQVLLDLGL
ncbi:uncharacterized protein LOC128997448 [Macrosteles quadrilineatus]|uniref:uncharacterized protein LOC128997448 n=1 Tax=Macrosteles quadrilineatus TaxID=74068 RepID=UPI0023E0DEA5|nr:uncharacterized protein LOC128997448 [Macrosteles quadrilineatus]